MPAPSILLCSLNARYIHASLGLRYLLANMARHGSESLRAQTVLREYTVARAPQAIAQDLLLTLAAAPADTPRIIGFGVYIWNVAQTLAVITLIKAQQPSITIVLGGPEVSHETAEQAIVALADYVITGWGDLSFPKLCRALVHGPRPLLKIIPGEQPPLDDIALPYDAYSDTDLAQRVLYVEASRGCPFKCEFCLSALDKTAWAFALDAILQALERLHQRGARQFKFVDRTFNLKIDTSAQLLQFFLDRLTPELQLHFEVIPDHLPDRLKDLLAQFPPGVLQLEVGIQTFNETVQRRISRRQDNVQTEANLRWLLAHTQAHLHTDLIFGLPGESLQSFADGFDRLYALGPHEIQLGLLKRLRGTPIARHTATYGMVYDTHAPYAVQQTQAVDAVTVQGFVRLARYWDLLANSGRFAHSLRLVLKPPRDAAELASAVERPASPYFRFLALSDWLWQHTERTQGLTPEALVDALFSYLTQHGHLPASRVRAALLADYVASGARAQPRCLQGLLPKPPAPAPRAAPGLAQRQLRHTASTEPTQASKMAP